MDASHRLWQDDYRREVEEVLARMRADRAHGVPVAEPPQSVVDAVLPPAGVYEDLRQARERLVRLERDLAHVRERYRLDSLKLERESRRRERLKQLVVKLHWTVGRLDTERRDALDKAAAAAERVAEMSANLKEKLHEANEGRAAEAAIAQEERARALQWSQEARKLQARVDDVQLKLDQKQAMLDALEKRLEAAAASHQGVCAEASARIAALEERLTSATAESARAGERVNAERSASREALASAHREAELARDEARALMARLDQALGELKSERERGAESDLRAVRAGELEHELGLLRDRLRGALTEGAESRAEAASFRGEAEGLRESVKTLETRLSEALARVQQLEVDVAAEAGKVGQAEDRLSEARRAAAAQIAEAQKDSEGLVLQARLRAQAELAEVRARAQDAEKAAEDAERAAQDAVRRAGEAAALADRRYAEAAHNAERRIAEARAEAEHEAKEARAAAEETAASAEARVEHIRREAERQIEAAKKLAQEAAARAKADAEKAFEDARRAAELSAAEARAEASRRVDGVLAEDHELQKTLAELRQAHERDRQKILEECAESLDEAKHLAELRRGEVPPAKIEPPKDESFLSRFFRRG